MSDWKNRPIYKKITREILTIIPDDLLAWAMHDHIRFKVGKNYERILQVLAELPAGFSVVYYLFALDGEIGNGGFNQYFFNGLDRDAEQHLNALRLIEATEHQKVFQEAFRIRDEEKQNEELQHRYAQHTIESFFSTYEMTELGMFDEEWYALDKELDALLIRFIRQHPELFITEE
jgi:hypothetical protein